MSPNVEHNRKPPRRISQAAVVCFGISAIAFFACGLGLFVNHMLTGALAISGTAAVGLIYLAMGFMNLEYTTAASDAPLDEVDARQQIKTICERRKLDASIAEFVPWADQHVSSTRETAGAERD